MNFNVRTDRALIRAEGHSRRYALVTLAAPEAKAPAQRPPANVALVMDRSGSMGGRKIELVREAVRKALAMLRSEDRFALVVYDHEIDVPVESTAASAEALQYAACRLAEIEARGNTNLSGGWLRGCDEIASLLPPGATGRCLLLTDGLANEGIRDADELSHLASGIQARGIATSTFGVGADFDEELLQRIAVAGGGHSYFVETPVQLTDLLTSELGEVLETVADGAAIEIALPAGVRASCLNEFPTAASETGVRIELGRLVSRQDVSVAVRLEFPRSEPGQEFEITFALHDREGVLDAPAVRWTWTSTGQSANDIQPRDRAVDHVVAGLYTVRACRTALVHNRKGDFEAARRILQATADRILGYAGDDPQLHRLAHQLLAELEVYSARMDPIAMKARFYSAQHAMRMRNHEGKARKRADN